MWFSYKNMNIRWETRDLMRLWKEKKGEIWIDDEKGNWKEKDTCSNHPACPAVFLLFCDFKNVIVGNLVGFTLNQGFYPSVSARLHRCWTGGRCWCGLLFSPLYFCWLIISPESVLSKLPLREPGGVWPESPSPTIKEATVWLQNLSSSILSVWLTDTSS